MTPDEFTLQATVPPDPHLLDEEVATHDWPLPQLKARAAVQPKVSVLSTAADIWRVFANSAWFRGWP
jgi:hypothetical protein